MRKGFFYLFLFLIVLVIVSCYLPQINNLTHSEETSIQTKSVVSGIDSDIGIWYSTWYSKVGSISQIWKTGFGTASENQFVQDCDGDGYADAVTFEGSTGQWRVALSTGASFTTDSAWITGHGVGSDIQLMGDVNGDGKADAVVYFASSGAWYVSLSSGSAFGNYNQWISGFGSGSDETLLADVDGDSKEDALLFSGGIWYVALSTGSSFSTASTWITGFGTSSSSRFSEDINGDGKADALTFQSDGTWQAAFSTGSGFGTPFTWLTGHGYGSSAQLVVDGDGFGQADAYVFFNTTGDFYGDWYVSKSGSDLNGNFKHAPPLQFNDNFGGASDKQFAANVAPVGDDAWKECVTFTASTGTWEVQRYRSVKENLYDLWNAWNIEYLPHVDGSYTQYDSGNSDIIDAHLSSLTNLGIDFIIMDESNNLYVDDGFIFNRAKKVAERIRIWNDNPSNTPIKYAIAIGGIQWSHNPATIEYEAGEVYDEFVNTTAGGMDNYYYLDGKPLLINYCIPDDKNLWTNYTGDKTNSGHFNMRWAHSPASAGSYGWETRAGTIEDEEVMLVMPGWNNNQGTTPVLRNNGDYYALDSWNRVLGASYKPDIVVINSWNEYAEETAIEPASTSNCTAPTEKWYNKSGIIDDFMYQDMTERYINLYKNESWQASDLFGDGQGWYMMGYQEKSGSSYSDMTWDGTNSRWTGSGAYCLIGSDWQHPDTSDSARTWTAPYTGTVTLSGTVRKQDINGDGISASILRNSTCIWGPYTITNTTGQNYNFTTTVSAGDIIYFEVNRNIINSYDTTLWDPKIEY